MAILLPATLSLVACKPAIAPVASITPAGTSALARATAHVQMAQEQVDAAKPSTNSAGLTHLEIATQQQKYALDEQATVAKSFQVIDQQYQALAADRQKLQERYDTLYHSWGATAERWIRRVFWIWLIGHVGLGIAALFIPGSAGAIVAAVAAALNPAAWFQAIRDNAYFRYFSSRIAPAGSSSSDATKA